MLCSLHSQACFSQLHHNRLLLGRNHDGPPSKWLFEGAASRNAVDWSLSGRSNSDSCNFRISLSEGARIASYAYFNFLRRVATPFNYFSADFLRESPSMSLPLLTVLNRIFQISFSCCAPHWAPVVA